MNKKAPQDDDRTSIPLTKRTRERLKDFGKKSESWDQLLNRLLDKVGDV